MVVRRWRVQLSRELGHLFAHEQRSHERPCQRARHRVEVDLLMESPCAPRAEQVGVIIGVINLTGERAGSAPVGQCSYDTAVT